MYIQIKVHHLLNHDTHFASLSTNYAKVFLEIWPVNFHLPSYQSLVIANQWKVLHFYTLIKFSDSETLIWEDFSAHNEILLPRLSIQIWKVLQMTPLFWQQKITQGNISKHQFSKSFLHSISLFQKAIGFLLVKIPSSPSRESALSVFIFLKITDSQHTAVIAKQVREFVTLVFL